MQPIIRVRHLSKRYGRQVALERVSFEVPRGVVFGLLGENGAGKTTAIKSLLGLVEPDGGSAEVLGLDSRHAGREIRRQVGYVPERATLYEWMTVAEIGWFTSGLYDDRYLGQYLQLVRNFELPEGRKIGALSKGMRAKVALSLALAHQPELLILDEPTSGLDTLVRRQFLESMVDLAAQGRTVLLSSHQIAEVERVADIVAILRDGKLLVIERLDELRTQIQELTVTMENAARPAPVLRADVLRTQRRGRQWQILAHGVREEQLAELRGQPGVEAVESRSPNLEEIFVAYMQAGLPDDPKEAGQEVVGAL